MLKQLNFFIILLLLCIFFKFICFYIINKSVMKTSPRKNTNKQFTNQQYLNFIRKNHLQLQTSQIKNSQIRSNSNKKTQKELQQQEAFKQYLTINLKAEQQSKRKQNKSIKKNYQTLSDPKNDNKQSNIIISPKLVKQQIQSRQISQQPIVDDCFQNENKMFKSSQIEQNSSISQYKKINKLVAEKLMKKRKDLFSFKKQSIGVSSQKNPKNQNLNKDMCQLASKQLLQYQSKQLLSDQHQLANQSKQKDQFNLKFGNSLTLKEKQLIEMWKQSKLNKKLRYKKPQSEIKLPNIFTKGNKQEFLTNTDEKDNFTNRNYKNSPIIQSHQRYNSYNVYNKSSQIRMSGNGNSLKNYPQAKIDQLGSLQIKTIDSKKDRFYSNFGSNQIPTYKVSPSQYMRMKKKRGVPPKLTKLLEQPGKIKQKKQGKQLLQERQKQLSKCLMQNSILKSDKIVNYYEKQQNTKRNIEKNIKALNEQNKLTILNQQKVIVFNKYPIETYSQQEVCQNKNYLEQNQQDRYQDDFSNLNQLVNQKGSNLLERSHEKQKKKKGFQGVSKINNNDNLTIYQLKMKSYRQFLFMLNLAHKIFDPIILKEYSSYKNEPKYKYYIGKGNNSLLIKSLMKRRFWWQQEEDPKKANFVWTQIKINELFELQKKYQAQETNFDKILSEQEEILIKKTKKTKNNHSITNSKGGVFRAPFPQSDQKIFTLADKKYYDQYSQDSRSCTKDLNNFSNRLQYFPQNFLIQKNKQIHEEKMHNHFQTNFFIGNKKALYYNLKQYYDLQNKNVFEIIPYTLHLKKGTLDPAYKQFVKQFKKIQNQIKKEATKLKNVWIVKPGELSNRGQGITVIDQIYELNTILKKKEKHNNGIEKSYILQKYIEKPLLYKNRKFDIRHYMLITRLHGRMRAYFYGQGYIRTSSQQFNLQELDQNIHLTNDAIQKHCETYGKHEQANKVSYNQFQRYLDLTFGQGKVSFTQKIYPKMKSIALDAVKATYLQLDTKKLQHNFQVLGLDFMIDANFNVWLIQANTNPCLQLSSKLLGRIIPQMVQNTLRLTLDPLFPPPSQYPNSTKYLCPDNPLQRLQYQLIFDQARDGKEIQQLYKSAKQLQMGTVDEDDQIYQNQGKQIELQVQPE